MTHEVKALSDYFEGDAKWGDGKTEVTLSAPKLLKAVTDAIVVRRPLYKKVFKVTDHFYVTPVGEVLRYPTSGAFRKDADDKGFKRETRLRQSKTPSQQKISKVVYDSSYRDFVIIEVKAFEEWLSKIILEGKIDVAIKRKANERSVEASSTGIYTLASYKNGEIKDIDKIAKMQSDVIEKRKMRGEELGADRRSR